MNEFIIIKITMKWGFGILPSGLAETIKRNRGIESVEVLQHEKMK